MIVVLCVVFVSGIAHAAGEGSLQLSATPDVILSDGKSTTIVSAFVRDLSGNPVADGSSVQFTTTLGQLSSASAQTAHGVARVTLTSSSTPGDATINVTAFGSASGASTGQLKVTFTDNPDAVYTTGQSGWVHISCPEYLVYSADHKIIEADGAHGSVHFQYRTLYITADSLQIDLQSQSFLVHNAKVSRGTHTFHTDEMRYDLTTSGGVAVCDRADGHGKESDTVTGYALQRSTETVTLAEQDVQVNQYRFVDISDSQVVISARAIAINPGVQLQFTRATIYNGGKKVVSLPYHIMPLESNELFGQQVLGFGSQGFFVNIPIYYHVAPGSIGTLYIRNAAVAGASSVSATGEGIPQIPNSESGLELDLEHSYSLGRQGSGTFFLDGLTRGDWGAHWDHTQRFGPLTNTYFYLDTPDHKSLFGSSNVTHQFNGFSANFSVNASQDPGELGYSSSSTSVNAYLQTTVRKIAKSGINYSTTLSAQNGETSVSSSGLGTEKSTSATYDLDTRFATNPLIFGKQTSVNDSVTFGESMDRLDDATSPTINATLGMVSTRPKVGSLMLNYSYVYNPFVNAGVNVSSAISALESLYTSPSQHQLNLNYTAVQKRGFTYGLTTSYTYPENASNASANIFYHLKNTWGLGLSENYAHILFNTYKDTEFSVSRRFLGRDIVVSYSSFTGHFSFNLGSTANF